MADGHQTIASLDLACLVPSCTKLHTVHVESTTLDANAYAALASLAIDSLSIVRPSGGLLFAPDTATVARMVARVSNLRLATVPWVTDGMIVQLLTGCPRLRSLSIEHLSKISDEGIRQSVQRLDDMAARQIAASQSDARTCLETIEGGAMRWAGMASRCWTLWRIQHWPTPNVAVLWPTFESFFRMWRGTNAVSCSSR